MAVPRATLARQIPGFLLLLAVGLAGCAGRGRIESSGDAAWSGLGLTLALPEGSWKAKVIARDRMISFHPDDPTAGMALFRLRARKDDAADIALMRLLTSFEKKTSLLRGQRGIAEGIVAESAVVHVSLPAGTKELRALVFRSGDWMYELAAWGMDESAFEGVISSLRFSEKD